MTSYTTKAAYPYPDPSDQVADYPTTAAAFAGYLDNLPNLNVIINPMFDIWQRATTFTNPATGTYTADRWRVDYDGAGGTRSVYRSTQAVGSTASVIGGMQARHFLIFQITSAGTATTQSLSQRVESVRTFAGETITLSAYIRNDDSGLGVNTITAKAIQNFGTGGSPSSAVTTTLGTASVTGSWTRLHVHFTLPTLSGKTVGTNGDDYLEIKLDLGNQTGNLWLWGVQLEQNTTQTALERRPIQQELALCQRYYFEITGQTIVRNHGAYTYWLTPLSFPVQMRKAPVVVGRRSKTGTLNEFDADGGGVVATIGYGGHTPNEAQIYATSTTRNGLLWYSAEAEL